ncbi:metallophosphoesterase family protein [Chloroflexus sp.]|uniref:metallophosphoesterase family protein n=1 Tax=Chloroflexus sp. TaxID=1904827 RepID=UPI00262BA096|nr:metallophosphoesterase family protein [uncultured Chloroflexus sp.]
MAFRILHISDVHTGPPFNPAAAERLVTDAHALQPDLVVISGDFVQRADFIAQWRVAQALRDRLPKPQLVVAGNHDVPLFHLHERLFAPLRRYQQHISPDLNPVFTAPGLVIVGACTAHGWTVDGGKLYPDQIAALRERLTPFGPDTYKIVVWHHPVALPPTYQRKRVTITNASAAIRLLDELAVDLLLCGHLHVSFVGNTRDFMPDLRHGTYIVQSGTTTSRRGYGDEHGVNTCNLITVEPDGTRVQHLRLARGSDGFQPIAEHWLPRQRALVDG